MCFLSPRAEPSLKKNPKSKQDVRNFLWIFSYRLNGSPHVLMAIYLTLVVRRVMRQWPLPYAQVHLFSQSFTKQGPIDTLCRGRLFSLDCERDWGRDPPIIIECCKHTMEYVSLYHTFLGFWEWHSTGLLRFHVSASRGRDPVVVQQDLEMPKSYCNKTVGLTQHLPRVALLRHVRPCLPALCQLKRRLRIGEDPYLRGIFWGSIYSCNETEPSASLPPSLLVAARSSVKPYSLQLDITHNYADGVQPIHHLHWL
ncbi:uncharacterized protein BDR25DRAFT_357242 [Lindgomyces ingoldianus]|uniref:Uncharacterized protein n=1 Tax=Lindgomyces ingoldianus TaxID=673940 RepID=A0ACB6QPS9_9PLEO|nr:uncharacterized protein BDR25DRAFT_357242 [Lindgomyces ingoldianus]KAF2468885.1 hypothetical protein BDR25DRAFT_357242 [Lindgomyces ingoldianus]